MADTEHQWASPPDDGGHQGSFTSPGDDLQQRPTDPRDDADSEDGRHPALHRDAPSHRSLLRQAMPVSGMVWMVLILAAVFWIAYATSLGRM